MTPNDAHTAEPTHRAFDAMPVAVAIISHAGTGKPGSERTTYFNPAFARLTGYSREEFIGRTPLGLVGAQSDPGVAQQWRTALCDGTSFSAELLVSRRDERAVWMRISMQPFSLEPNASRYAFTKYFQLLESGGVELIDCQVYTEYLESFGAGFIPRVEFLERLKDLLLPG